MKIFLILLCIISIVNCPFQAMYSRTGTIARTPLVRALAQRPYQLIPKEKIPQEQNKKNILVSHREIIPQEKKPIVSLTPQSYWSLHTLLAGLGLGWLWESKEEKEQRALKEKNAVLERCKEWWSHPLYEFDQFLNEFGNIALADQLFEEMIHDKHILNQMMFEAEKRIPERIIPFIKKHHYTLACKHNGPSLLKEVMKNDSAFTHQMTIFGIENIDNLCRNAETDDFFELIIRFNQKEALNGLTEKAHNNVKQLIATKVGKQLIDDRLIQYSTPLAIERALLLVNPKNEFDLNAFNTCMQVIKDNPIIEQTISKTYLKHDFTSLVKKIVYQTYCTECLKENLSHASVSLQVLSKDMNGLSSDPVLQAVIANRALSTMVMNALDSENQYKNTHYMFYHGQPSTLGFQQRLFSWLITKNDDKMMPIIYPLPKTEEEKLTEDETIKKKGEHFLARRSDERTYGLFTVGNIFSNITLRLAIENKSNESTALPSITIEETCYFANQEKVYEIFKDELEKLQQEYNKLPKKGQLIQFRVKKDAARTYVKPNGTLAENALIEKTGDYTPLLYGSTEFGVRVGLDLVKPDSGIACSIINSVDPTEWAAYETKEKALRTKIEQYFKSLYENSQCLEKLNSTS